ncbi:hypothetical protein ACFX2I_003401 [Malus domestica]
MAMLFGVLDVTALLGQSDEVGEDRAAEPDMEEGIDGAGLDVLGLVVVQAFLQILLGEVDEQHRLIVVGQILQLQSLDLVVESPHRHVW